MKLGIVDQAFSVGDDASVGDDQQGTVPAWGTRHVIE